jgi:pyridoxal phosphate enzyme (YggS family)
VHELLISLGQTMAEFPRARLIAVTKMRHTEQILLLYRYGLRAFGENHALEMRSKALELPSDCEWHFIGHLQTNKVKTIAPYVHTIHSVDSLRLMDEIQRRAASAERMIRILLQVHIAKEEHKYGIKPEALHEFMRSIQENNYPNLMITGLMGMATQTEDQGQIRSEFRLLHDLFQQIQKEFPGSVPHFTEISMGMSGDYLIALEEGSTMLRIGSLLFE